MNHLAQVYLKTHSLAQLRLEEGIKSSAKPGDLFFSLNYDQIESKAGPMVNQCRGVVLGVNAPLTDAQVSGDAPVGDSFIMARPFDRFFNLGDGNAAPVDMDDPETVFFEKLDGTLCILYFNTILGKWCVATRAVPLADKPMSGWDDLTFRGLFEKALCETLIRANWIDPQSNPSVCFNNWTRHLNTDRTFMFELTTPLNRIVVEYKDYTVTLLGIRDTQSGEEFSMAKFGPDFAYVPVCISHKLNNQKELLEFVGSKPPFEQEGIVVLGKAGRVKVKSLAYMAFNRVRDSSANSPRAIVSLILEEQLDDVLPVLELYVQAQAVKIQDAMRELFKTVDQTYLEIFAEIQGQENQRKAFALSVQARKAWMAPLMDRFSGKCVDFADYLQKRKSSEGGYPDGFLDSILSQCNIA